MQWILQDFEDTRALATALDRLSANYSWHKVVPFVGELEPEPEIADTKSVVLFGSYSLRHYAEKRHLKPGIFRLRPFVFEAPWQPFLLNGIDAQFLKLEDIPSQLAITDELWFVRPVDDTKETPGKVMSACELVRLARKVLALHETEIPKGSLRHDTKLMLTTPVNIQKEWRVWIVDGQVLTYSLYKEHKRIAYRNEIDSDALSFAMKMAQLNPDFARAYVLDICRTNQGLKIIETNCINAAGFYAADLMPLASAIDQIKPID